MATLNWKFGCNTPLDWGPDVDDQLARQVALWNRLVELEAENRAEYRRIVETDLTVAELTRQIDALADQLQAARERRAAWRKAARSKAPTQDDERITRLTADLQLLRVQAVHFPPVVLFSFGLSRIFGARP